MIHLSRWWNPAVEDQATDRAYRIGQTKPVTIHIPMAVHPDEAIGPSSFDQRLDALMERKRSMSRGLLMPPESDRDADDLLSDVLDGRKTGSDEGAEFALSSTPSSSDGQAIDVTYAVPDKSEAESQVSQEDTADVAPEVPVAAEPAPEATVPASRRPVLSVRTPVEAAEARTPSVQRVVYEQYGPRDWTIFEQFVREARIERLEIQDPYCCADEQARGRLLNFVSRFSELAAKLDEVRIVTFDADSVDKRMAETNGDQRSDLENRWKNRIGSIPLHLAQCSRRSRGDLHDRFVRAQLDNGDAVIWDLGRGIDGVMSSKWSCVVNAFHDKSSASIGLRGHRLQKTGVSRLV
nr:MULTISPECIES: hypothetical protein [unclassified Iodidimonas]